MDGDWLAATAGKARSLDNLSLTCTRNHNNGLAKRTPSFWPSHLPNPRKIENKDDEKNTRGDWVVSSSSSSHRRRPPRSAFLRPTSDGRGRRSFSRLGLGRGRLLLLHKHTVLVPPPDDNLGSQRSRGRRLGARSQRLGARQLLQHFGRNVERSRLLLLGTDAILQHGGSDHR